MNPAASPPADDVDVYGHGYSWPDLREVPIGTLAVGDVLFKPDQFQAYWTRTDGTVVGAWAFNGLAGTAWTITARDGDAWTVERQNGKFSQSFRRPDGWKTLAVARAVA